MCECRSPRMSSSANQLRQLARARGLQLAAVLAQLGRHEGHAQQLVDLLLGRALRAGLAVSSSTIPYSLTCRPRLTASVRSASLWRAEPVKCWSRLPKLSSGTIRRSIGQALVGERPRARLAGAGHVVQAGQRRERLHQRRGVARRGHDVQVLAGVGPAPRAARQLHAQRGRVLAQARRPGPRPAPAPSTAAVRVRALPSAPSASAASTFSSALAPNPGTSLSRPCSAASRRSSSDATPSASCSRRTRLGPSPGMCVISTRPTGILALSLSADGDRPGLEQHVDLLGDRLADARPAPRRGPARTSRPPTRRPRGSTWPRCGRPARGRPRRRRARRGCRAPRSGLRSRRSSSARD